MKIQHYKADGFIKDLPGSLVAALVYGPDEGVKRERAKALIKGILGDGHDPFDLIELSQEILTEDPARLLDEMHAISLTGNRRVVHIRDASDKLTKLLEPLTQAPVSGQAFVVIEANDLSPRSSLRLSFEKPENLAAIACYNDEGASLVNLIRDEITKAGYAIERDALGFMAENCGSNRMLTLQEIEKLLTYMGDTKTIQLGDVQQIVGDTSAQVFEEMMYAVTEGNLEAIDRMLHQLYHSGEHPPVILMRLSRHFQKILYCRGKFDQNKDLKAALDGMRPPVFFKYKDRFATCVRNWTLAKLSAALDVLAKADRQAKTTGLDADVTCRMALFKLGQLARRPA